MKSPIEAYPTFSKPYISDLHKAAWNYSREIHRLLTEGYIAAEAVSQTRYYYDTVVWEVESMTHAIGGPGCPNRAAVMAGFRAVEHILTRNPGNLAPTIRNLGDALTVPRMPKILTFTLQGKGWWRLNLIALYIARAREQHQRMMRRARK